MVHRCLDPCDGFTCLTAIPSRSSDHGQGIALRYESRSNKGVTRLFNQVQSDTMFLSLALVTLEP
jgi:hypothetical protein